MNQLYDVVQVCIKSSDPKAIPNLLEHFQKEQISQKGTLFSCSSSLQYTLKRLINACLSVDSNIKVNSYATLQAFSEQKIMKDVNEESIKKFIIDTSNYKKHLKKNQMEGYAVGRIMLIKSLKGFFQNDVDVMGELFEMIKDFPSLEQQIIEVCFLISNDKNSILKFKALSPKNQASRLLYKILSNEKVKKKDQKIELKEIQEVLLIQKQKFPQKSLCLEYIGRYLSKYVESPFNFFRKYSQNFLNPQVEADIHQIYYTLLILRQFLNVTTINMKNYKEVLDIKMMVVWLDQFRVLNKRMKNLALSIQINFDKNSDFAFKLLQQFHNEKIYLDNMSQNHPFASLYRSVQASKYWKYIYDICLNQKQEKGQENQEEVVRTHINELVFFVQLRLTELQEQQIGDTLIYLINKHTKKQQKQILYLINNLQNSICTMKKKKKKNNKINSKALLILTKISSEKLNHPEEFHQEFNTYLTWIKKKTIKFRKQTIEASEIQIHFYNFCICLLYFSLIYPQQMKTCQELMMVEKKLFQEAERPPQKKVKRDRNGESQKEETRPISVLTDIFISLMTRPPHFLRNTIHFLYETVLPKLDENDLGNMLTVITTPDAEFIEEI